MTTLGIKSYLVHTVSVVRPTIVRGARTTVTTSGVSARIVNRTRMLLGKDGDTILSQMTIYMLPDANVEDGDEIIADGLQLPVAKIIRARDGTGNVHHLEVLLA